MADTLGYVWRVFLDELLAARTADPAGGEVDREWGGAQVRFRLAPVNDTVPGHVLLMSVRGGEPPFRLDGSLMLDQEGDPSPEGVVWRAGGDHEELVAWMIPWVALHVERGGGWIDF